MADKEGDIEMTTTIKNLKPYASIETKHSSNCKLQKQKKTWALYV